MFDEEETAEDAASFAKNSKIFGKKIRTRGPAEQREKGYSGKYKGKIGNVPTLENDKRPFTDCRYYATATCNNGQHVSYIIPFFKIIEGHIHCYVIAVLVCCPCLFLQCPYRHSDAACNQGVMVCPEWRKDDCTNIHCPLRHPDGVLWL